MLQPTPDFVQRVAHYADTHGGAIYSPIPHPSFEDFEAVHGPERWDLIKQQIPASAKTALDIGAHWGYWSHALEGHGLKTTATESSEDALYFMREIRRLTGAQFEIIGGDVLDLRDPDFDLVLALNIFHHFLKRPATLEKFKAFLGRLKCHTMIYQAHGDDESQMRNAHLKLDGEGVCQLIVDNSGLTDFEYVGTIKNRKVYKLWQDASS